MANSSGRGQTSSGTFAPPRLSGRGYAGTAAAQRPPEPQVPRGRAATPLLTAKDQLDLARAPKLRGPIGWTPVAPAVTRNTDPTRSLDGWSPVPPPGAQPSDNGLGLLSSPIHGDYQLNPRDPDHRIAGGWFGAPRGTGERTHQGHDVTAAPGTPIYPAGPGRVSYAGVERGYGNTVEVDMGHGFKTRYGHLSEIYVKAGDPVTQDQQIGAAGTSGNAKLDPAHPDWGRPHLHWEVIRKGQAQDPYVYLGPTAYTDRPYNLEEIRRAFVD